MFVAYEEKQCAACNAPFIPKTPNQKYCSQRCYQKHYRETYREKMKAYRRSRDRKISNEYKRTKRLLRKINETCAKKYDNCFSCPYEDCIQE